MNHSVLVASSVLVSKLVVCAAVARCRNGPESENAAHRGWGGFGQSGLSNFLTHTGVEVATKAETSGGKSALAAEGTGGQPGLEAAPSSGA